jgi:large subunit ribosomal protein L6
MSRIAKAPIEIPSGVEVKVAGQNVSIKGSKGAFNYAVHQEVTVTQEGNALKVGLSSSKSKDYSMAGTMRSLLSNMVQGVSQGFERKLELVGVGYRAKAQGAKLNLTLGFSHPVEYAIPAGITVETPSQTEILVKGIDRQQVGQVAADIRAYRPPEPYKGKGVKYSDERIVRKEAKKK